MSLNAFRATSDIVLSSANLALLNKLYGNKPPSRVTLDQQSILRVLIIEKDDEQILSPIFKDTSVLNRLALNEAGDVYVKSDFTLGIVSTLKDRYDKHWLSECRDSLKCDKLGLVLISPPIGDPIYKNAYHVATVSPISVSEANKVKVEFKALVKQLRFLQVNNPEITIRESLAKYNTSHTDVVLLFKRKDGHIKTRDFVFMHCALGTLDRNDRAELFAYLIKHDLQYIFPAPTWEHLLGMPQAQIIEELFALKKESATPKANH